MSEEQTTIVSVNTDEITIIIDNNIPNLSPISNILNKLILNYDKFDMTSNNIISNSSLYLNLEQIKDLEMLKPLSANWQETFSEVNILQDTLSANWEKTYEIVKSSIVNGGTF